MEIRRKDGTQLKNLELANQFLDAFSRFRRNKLLFPVLEGIPRAEFFIMHCIGVYQKKNPEKMGVRISALSAQSGMSMPAVSQVLNSMEEKGYVERCMTKSDRRVVYVCLTETGQGLLRKAMEEFCDFVGTIVENFGEEKTLTLIGLMNELSDVIGSLRPDIEELLSKESM